ncbi:MAG: tetratricopeptide repeat protein, partial [Thermoanaerobaculia bacterium]
MSAAMGIDHLRSIAQASYAAKSLVPSGSSSRPRARQRTVEDTVERSHESPTHRPEAKPETDTSATDEQSLQVRRFRHKQLQDALDQERWVTARTLARRLAEQGDAEAQYHLGGLHVTGKGGKIDLSEASRWLRRAAARGHPVAERLLHLVGGERQYRIGRRYLEGSEERAPDWKRAVKWLRHAADRRHLAAIDLLS